MNFNNPELRNVGKKASLNDKNLKMTLDSFASDMEKVSKAAIDFFNKWEKGGDGIEFAKDIGSLISVLRSRIHREESNLYPEFDRITDKKSA